MGIFFTLYLAEIRKVLQKKSVWAGLAVGLAFVLAVGLTNLSADGRGAYIKYQEEKLTAMSGELMDQSFFDRFQNEIREEIAGDPEKYEKALSKDAGAGYLNAASSLGKRALYDLIYNTVRDKEKVMEVSAQGFYDAMKEDIIKDGHELGATDGEIGTWLSVFEGVEKPMRYSYALAYLNILDVTFIIGWVLIINISIALSGMYADEKTYRMDALILSARKGRSEVCLSKIAAGITIAVLEALLLFGTCIGVMFFFYSPTGWNAVIQNVIPSSPWNITIGKMMGILVGFSVIVSALFAASNMLISHLTKSSTATLAIHAAFVFIGLFNIPGKLGLLAKIWQLRPTMALYYGTFCNTFMYGRLNNVEISLLLYGIALVIFLLLLDGTYRNSQVESR